MHFPFLRVKKGCAMGTNLQVFIERLCLIDTLFQITTRHIARAFARLVLKIKKIACHCILT